MLAKETLEITSQFQLVAQNTMRFVDNPHVPDKESVAQHIGRCVRLAAYILPDLMEEFADHPEVDTLEKELLLMLIFHDDEQVIEGKNTSSFSGMKSTDYDKQTKEVAEYYKNLSQKQVEVITTLFSSAKYRHSLTAKIAKVIDHLCSNQVMIEQKVGLAHPDYAIVSIEYIEKLLGTSKTTDELIAAQKEKIYQERERLANDHGAVSDIALDLKKRGHGHHDDIWNNMMKLLRVDIKEYIPDPQKAYIPVWEYDIDAPIPLEE